MLYSDDKAINYKLNDTKGALKIYHEIKNQNYFDESL